MTLRSALLSRYEALKSAYLAENNLLVPRRYASSFVAWGGCAEVQHIYRKFAAELPKNARVLIVGVMGGRDYYLFRCLGFDVTALDLGPQPEIAPICIHNVEEPLPFPDGSFDAVLIGEVLEHLRNDVAALENLRRVLKPIGQLIVSLPYYNDHEAGHMRIHSPISAQRLLSMGGFEVADYVERPALIHPSFLNPALHLVSLMWYWLFGKTAYGFLGKWMGDFSYRLGKMPALRLIRRMSRHYGGFMRCVPSRGRLDHIQTNRSLYTSSGAGQG